MPKWQLGKGRAEGFPFRRENCFSGQVFRQTSKAAADTFILALGHNIRVNFGRIVASDGSFFILFPLQLVYL